MLQRYAIVAPYSLRFSFDSKYKNNSEKKKKKNKQLFIPIVYFFFYFSSGLCLKQLQQQKQ